MKETSSPAARTNAWLWIAAGVLLGIGVGAAGLALIVSGGILPWRSATTAISPAVPQVNAPAPPLNLKTLDGQAVSLADLQGKTILLNFWATWCGPCRSEMPLLQQAQDRYPDRLVVLAVNDGEEPEQVRSFVKDIGLSLAVLLDPERLMTERYRVRGFPTTVFIDPTGVIRYQHIGVLSQDTLAGYLSDLGIKP